MSKGGPLEDNRTPLTRARLDLPEDPDSKENCKVGDLFCLLESGREPYRARAGGQTQYLACQRETGQLLYSGRWAGVVAVECLSVIDPGQQQEHSQSQ